MLDTKDFNFFESQNSFDFKGFLLKILGYWKWFVLSLILTFVYAYNVNIRKEKIYGMESHIVVEDQNNPFFTSNTSLIFNWGGTSDKVQTIITTLKSRSHNEIVVDKLQYYIKYLKKGEYFYQDVYGEVPFYVEIDKNKGQLFGQLIKIKFLSPSQYELSVDFAESTSTQVIQYSDLSFKPVNVSAGEFKKVFKINEEVDLPFLNLKVIIKPDALEYANQEYYVRFDDFNGTVAAYKGIDVSADAKALSVVRLQMEGSNKYRLVEYLNTTVDVLRKIQFDSKNQFANNTIRFIDSTLKEMEDQIKEAENELKEFRRGKNIFELEEEGGSGLLSAKLSGYDVEKDAINRKIAYYNLLKNYLEKTTDYSKLPAPTVAGIDDPNVIGNISKLIQLSAERANMSYSVKNKKLFSDFDVEMESIKKVLLENIASAKSALNLDLSLINRNIAKAEGEASLLPENKQEHIKITRKYNLKDKIYSTFLEKRSEAEIVKAANISDISFLDRAKDVGGGLRGPKTSINYILAAMLGFLVPLLVIFVIILLDNSINTTDDIQKLTKIPLIGVIGKKNTENNLSVFEKPKSPLAESFRAIRSSLQFMYKKQQKEGAKILMLTSSVSGEGKTFCSINLATVFALSEKKTVIVGLDLRKPKIFGDFNIDNVTGVVNYLIGQKTIDEVIQKTHIPNLDVIPSGPIPPNPSELLMSEAMAEMIEELKTKYDYIVLDTPPVGLVSDALELAHFCDATLYVTRQGFTKKGMLSVVNEKHKRGELHNISIILMVLQIRHITVMVTAMARMVKVIMMNQLSQKG
ncbi:polysaccharide biosynthesis tyrosine autokinase [Flavobacterium haoranii]|uniref:non-specific protein-tyrosine kinase n=1 Tax=Flavobacterium haoranii TaxID=683124 RepID=A0A1M6CQB9_9FLAO|nr:polysaccharide biosynthesis tyrosine autokinase [Flavobacterium haoranii]SHI63176.1 protein involved in gliding motility EpsB [Flavobacterium haoranii]